LTEPTSTLHIDGTCAPGFERVREAFEAGASDLGRGGGAFCAFVGSEKVVDLWGGQARPGSPWAEDTLAVLMSSTKGFVALCAQILHCRGELDIEAPVATYWPEFAQAGKEKVTVRHVLTHTAGVIGVPGHREFMSWDGTGWDDYDEISRRLAAATPAWEPGTEVGYHALTYGWLMGEIMRRITGKTAGELFRDEVATPLGLDARIGTPDADLDRVAVVLGEDMSAFPPEVQQLLDLYLDLVRDPTTLAGQAFLAADDDSFLDKVHIFASDPDVLRLELPAGNGTSTARSLAKMYALLACGGELDGVRLVSPESIAAFGTEQVRQVSAMGPMEMSQALGYHTNFGGPMPPPFGPNPATFGHGGAGGQVGCCDPDAGLAIGFVRNHMTSMPGLSGQLIDALYGCIA
jgi:CubicO group peptidase (beta-lactamase class C family)